MPADPALRRATRAKLCRIEKPKEVESLLAALWVDSALPMSAIGTI
jgi:hypothetical protein